jgi:hypothetical protein
MPQAEPPIRKNLIECLPPSARHGLTLQLISWPGEELPAEAVTEFVAQATVAAREILRLYPWPSDEPLPADHPRAGFPYPWRAVTYDRSRWRAVGPEWEPAPHAEYLCCASRDDPPAFIPDLRFDALDLLYWLAAIRDAQSVSDAMVAGWRAADARARLSVELELRDVLSTGLRQRINAARKGGKRAAKPELHKGWLTADLELESAEPHLSARERAERITDRGGQYNVAESTFRNSVANLRKKSVDNLA